jgi:hypothetical protein
LFHHNQGKEILALCAKTIIINHDSNRWHIYNRLYIAFYLHCCVFMEEVKADDYRSGYGKFTEPDSKQNY